MSLALRAGLFTAALASDALADSAVWVHEFEKRPLRGMFRGNTRTGLDAKARVAAHYFHCRAADAPGVAIGDALLIGGQYYDVTDVQPHTVPGELILPLRLSLTQWPAFQQDAVP